MIILRGTEGNSFPEICFESIIGTGFDVSADIEHLLDCLHWDVAISTGYGRNRAAAIINSETISEISAFALGGIFLYPHCRTILDIGGQDTKVIRYDDLGRILRFEMNDRCAAGTGKFMELSAMTLGMNLVCFSNLHKADSQPKDINSMCAVFAESEMVSLIHSGATPEEVGLGVIKSVASRAASMLGKIGLTGPVAFAGGGSLNQTLSMMISSSLGVPVITSEKSQFAGALGCALKGLGWSPAWGLSQTAHQTGS